MTENKGRAGRKPVDLRTLIFWEWHWWQAFSLIRDGVIGGQEIDGGLFPVADWKDPVRPAWMTHPGAIHEWEKKVREDYYSRFEQKSYYSKGVPVERHLWEALKRARTARQVRRICSQSRWRSRLSHLYEHAEEFLHALKKEDCRYPRKAQTKDDRRLLICAQVMAGISCRVPPATAVDKLRKLKHGRVRSCACAECTNVKESLLQWILFDLYEKTNLAERTDFKSSLALGLLAKLDNGCGCTHCSLPVSVREKASGRQRRL